MSHPTSEASPALSDKQVTPHRLPHGCRCGARWNGNATAHCGARCHLTFTVVSAFDKHRRNGECVDPAKVGLVARERGGYTAWGYPDSGDPGRKLTEETPR